MPDMERCQKCGRALNPYDIGLTKKLINRGAARYYCMDCLGELFGVDREFLCRKIRQFQRAGCSLFPPMDSGDLP